jgi:hypothetical protein
MTRKITDRDVARLGDFTRLAAWRDARALENVLDHDWSHAPALEARIEPIRRSTSASLAEAVARALLQDWLAAVADNGTHLGAQVLKRHDLQREKWDILEAELERDKTTLRRRRTEALRELLEWLTIKAAPMELSDPGRPPRASDAIVPQGSAVPLQAEGARDAVEPQVAAAPNARFPAKWRARSKAWILVGLGGLVVALGMIKLTRPSGWQLPAQAIGANYELTREQPTLPSWFPRVVLPEIGSAVRVVMPFEAPGGNILLAMGTYSDVRVPGRVVIFDPVSRACLAPFDFRPPPGAIVANAHLDTTALRAPFGVRRICYGNSTAHLDGVIACVFWQRFHPVFVEFLDVQTGQSRSRYYHPGQLGCGQHAVADFDEDGVNELALFGVDNMVNRPVVVVLGPKTSGMASTAVLAEGQVREAAEYRFFLPAIIDTCATFAAVRFQAFGDEFVWDSNRRCLRGYVGAPSKGLYDFQIYFPRGGEPRVDFSLGDAGREEWKGCDPDALTGYFRSNFDVVRQGEMNRIARVRKAGQAIQR